MTVAHDGAARRSADRLRDRWAQDRPAFGVRVPWNDPAQVMRAVDTGAAAVVVPMLNGEQDAQLAASACRFPPAGVRCGVTRDGTERGRRSSRTRTSSAS